MKEKRLVVIGGGAAGFFGAIRARTVNPLLEVVLLEAGSKFLSKVKISGGGRCNVTHACFDVLRLVENYRGRRELIGVLTRFGPQETVRWFEANGVRLKTEPDGRMFPVTDDSQTVIDCLLRKAQETGVRAHAQCPVQQLEKRGDAYVVQTPDQAWEADAVLLATGNARRSFAWTARLGHSLLAPVPSLFTFNIAHPLLADLAGTSFARVRGSLEVSGEKAIIQEGPLLITHWGLSGPLVLRLSAWGARPLYNARYRATLGLDFFPDSTPEELRVRLAGQKAEQPKRHIGNDNPQELSNRFWQKLLTSVAIPPELSWAEVSQKSLNGLGQTLKRCALPIHGKGVFKEEFVTAGGIPLKEIDFRKMESRCAPELYFAGEVIDVDGLTGGFNFQNAWSTGWVAGEAIARWAATPSAAS